MEKKKITIKTFIILYLIFFLAVPMVGGLLSAIGEFVEKSNEKNEFRILASASHEFFGDELEEFAKKNKIKLDIQYRGDLEIVDILNSKEELYDAVWISNSIWLYMLDNSYLVTDSKSIAINPVVMAVKKSKAEELSLAKSDVKNSDLLEAIRTKKLNYVMASVTKTNTGATAYLGFLNSLAGSPEVISSDMLKNPTLIQDLRTFFNGVERVSGDELYLEEMFMNGNYDAIINYESRLIDMNKRLQKEGKEELYLVYPEDGVAINDMPFGYVERNQNKKETFEKFLNFLRSEETATELEKDGLRTWFGGTKKEAQAENFKKEWGINTEKYLIPLKYPGKKVITEALDLYVEQLRKPNHTVFCLDVSGSMYGYGLTELKDAMNYILNRDEARKDRLQFSPYDKISVITFNSMVQRKTITYKGDDTSSLLTYIDGLNANGGTNIYDPTIEALKILGGTDGNEYTKTVILMTDGESNNGTFSSLKRYYESKGEGIPIYSIMFGSSSEEQLRNIADLSNAKIFNGKAGLKKAFQEVRSYN